MRDSVCHKLSKRLEAVYSMISPGERVVDVGTDHGFLPISLVLSGKCRDVGASDIAKGPLQKAINNAESAGVSDNISFYLCSGLEGVPEIYNTIVISGMGGETIISILEKSGWALKKKLILQPQTKKEELYCWLKAQGCYIKDCSLIYEQNFFYTVWNIGMNEKNAEQGIKTEYKPSPEYPNDLFEALVPNALRQNPSPLLPDYISYLIAGREKIAESLVSSGRSLTTEQQNLLIKLREYQYTVSCEYK